MPGGASPPLRLAQRNSVASQNSPLPYFKTVVPGGASPLLRLAQRISVASQNSKLSNFKTLVACGPSVTCMYFVIV